MLKSDKERLLKIIDNWRQIQEEIEKNAITSDDIMNKRFVQWAITTPLYNIGEHVTKLSSDFKMEHKRIPWSKIAGLRHRLVHNYEGTNWSIVREVIEKDMPLFIEQLNEILRKDLEGVDKT